MKTKPKRWEVVVMTIGSSLTAILAVAFSFVEIRFLVSGDIAVYENPGIQTAKVLFRLLCFLVVLANACIGIIGLYKKESFTTLVILCAFSAMFISLLSFFFYEWYLSLALTLSNLLILAVPILGLIKQRLFFSKEEED